jgi:phenolic acid decarboxylase
MRTVLSSQPIFIGIHGLCSYDENAAWFGWKHVLILEYARTVKLRIADGFSVYRPMKTDIVFVRRVPKETIPLLWTYNVDTLTY